jgi:predicted peroxiredoxin
MVLDSGRVWQNYLLKHKEERVMNENVVITVSCGTEDPNRATRALHLATMAQKEGKNVTLFLLDEAVSLAREGLVENMRAVTGDVAAEHLAYLQETGVEILACTPCCKARRITEEELVKGARFGTAVELINLCCNDAAVISL